MATVDVQFPDGVRAVPAEFHVIADRNLQMGYPPPPGMGLEPVPQDGWRFMEQIGAGAVRWHAFKENN